MSEALRAETEAPRQSGTLVGHTGAAQTLRRAWESGRIAHGWMLAGPRGIGKATLAWRFAKFIHAPPATGPGAAESADPLPVDADAAAVRQVTAGTHPNCFLLRREAGPTTPHRLRAWISVDDVRRLGGFLAHTAATDGWRTVIVDAADDMNMAAANGILKLLEEPPARTLLLLVTHVPGRLPPTVRSRCRILKLDRLTEAQTAGLLLAHQPELDSEAATRLAQLADGSAGRALALAAAGGLEIAAMVERLLREPVPGEPVPGKPAPGEPVPGKPVPGDPEACADRLAPADAESACRVFFDLLQAGLRRRVLAAAGHGAEGRRQLAIHDRVVALANDLEALTLDRRAVVLAAATAARGPAATT